MAAAMGGAEIKEGRFFSSKHFNAGTMKRVENAGARLAAFANAHGVRIRATSAVSRYLQRNLLERATYRFEAVLQRGDGRTIEPLGEITVSQSLSPQQRTAIVEGKLLSRPDSLLLEYQLRGEVVRIDTTNLASISGDDIYTAGEKKLGDLIVGMEKQTADPATPRATEAKKAERRTIKDADRESAARTKVPPVNEAEVALHRAEAERAAKGVAPPAAADQSVNASPGEAAAPRGDAVGSTEAATSAHLETPLEPVHEGHVGGGVAGAAEGLGALLLAKIGKNLRADQTNAFQARMDKLAPFVNGALDSGNAVEIIVVAEKPNTFEVLDTLAGTSDQSQILLFRDAFISAIFPEAAPAQPADSISAAGSSPPPRQGGSIMNEDEIKFITPRDPLHHIETRKIVIHPREKLGTSLSLGADLGSEAARIRANPPLFVGTYVPDSLDQSSVGGNFSEVVHTGMHRRIRINAVPAADTNLIEMWTTNYGDEKLQTVGTSKQFPTIGLQAAFASSANGKVLRSIGSTFMYIPTPVGSGILIEAVSGNEGESAVGAWSARIAWKRVGTAT